MLITTLHPEVRTQQRRGVKQHEKLRLQCGKTRRNAIEEIEKAWAIAGAVQEPQRMLVTDNFYALHFTLERLVRLYPPVDKNHIRLNILSFFLVN